MLRKDNLILGIVLGLITPILALIIYYFVAFYPRNVSFTEFLGYLKTYRTVLTAISSISLIANAVVFTIYINSRRDKTVKGIFLATVVYAITVLVIKVI